MSGGSYDYFYIKIEEYASSIRLQGSCKSDVPGRGCASPSLRQAFRAHMFKVARAAQAIEWNDSCDGNDSEQELLKSIIKPGELIESAIERAVEAQKGLDESVEFAKGFKAGNAT